MALKRIESESLMLAYSQLFYFLYRSGTSDFKASVRPYTEYVDLTAQDCLQTTNVVHLDDLDNGKCGIKMMMIHTHLPYIPRLNNHIFSYSLYLSGQNCWYILI